MSLADDALDFLAAGAKGGVAGAAFGPVGAAIGVAMGVAPSVAKWLGADEQTTQKAVDIVKTATGTTDPVQQRAVLDADQGLEDDLHVQLVQLANERAAEENRALEARIAAAVADTAGARTQTVQLAQSGSKIAWGSVAMTVSVMAINAILVVVLLTRSYPAENKDIVLLLVGQVLGWGTAAVSYWLGSSSGSSDKSRTIADLSNAALAVLPKPAEIKPANKGA
jgi:hypothetical protein